MSNNKHKTLFNGLQRQIAEIPGVMEFYLLMCDLTGHTPAYDSGWRRLSQWLTEMNQVPASDELLGKHLLFFSDLPTHVDYSLAVAVLLLARGASVDFAWLSRPSYGSQVAPTIGYPFWRRSAKGMKNKQPHPRLRLFDLEKVQPITATPEMYKIAARQALMDTSYILLKESVNIDTNPIDKAEYDFRLNRNLDALRRVASLCGANKYDRVVLINGAILEFGALHNLISQMNIPTSTLEMPNNGTLVVSCGATVMGMDASDLWTKDEPHLLSKERRERILQLINNRQKPAEKEVNLDAQQLAGVVSVEKIRRQLDLQPDKPVVLVCPNCPFDAAYFVEGKKHFSTMVEWLVKTLEYLANRDDCQVIVRCHPAERYYQVAESTVNIIKDSFYELPAHIQVIKPEDPISTYSIMNTTDLGIVYWSTTGLEMAMRGIPVLGGVPSVHYNDKGFTLDPQTLDEYFQMIDSVLKDHQAARLTERQVELAWCYADVFFNDWPQPFPWGLGRRFWRDLKEWPITRMLSQEGKNKFSKTLVNLIGK